MVRLLSGLAYLALATQTINAASIPDANNALATLDERAPFAADIVSPDHTLERRKGGGGRGGGSSGGGSSSGGSSGGGRSNGGGGGSSRGSGPARTYGGGAYYGGGAATPYNSGRKSPKGLLAGTLIAPVAIVAIMPGLWLASVYPYYYNNPYRFYNRTANRTANNDNDNDRRDIVNLAMRQEMQGANETLPVMCLCAENAVCGCDENTDQTYINDLVGNGSYAALNKTLVTVSDVNGTRTLVLNGTLPPGTTAPGEGAASALSISGYWAMGLVVLYGVFM